MTGYLVYISLNRFTRLLTPACCSFEVAYFSCKVWMERTTLRCQAVGLTSHSLASWVWTNACDSTGLFNKGLVAGRLVE